MKNNYLPLVKPEISCSMEQDLIQHSDDSYVMDRLHHLSENNPVIYTFLKEFSKQSSDPIFTLFSGLIVYKMLESQAEADEMNSEYKINI